MNDNNDNENVKPTGETQSWTHTVKKLFDDNEAIDFLNVYVKCGMPKEIAFSKNVELIDAYVPIPKESLERDIFQTYQWALDNRYDLQKRTLRERNPEDDNLNIPDNEKLFHRISSTTLYEEKVIRRNFAYSGVRWSDGLLRAGSISVIGDVIKDFVPIDIGNLFITNKRILFIGKEKSITKALNISDVLTNNLYKDGVLISQPNKKAMLLKFSEWVDYKVFMIDDGLNEFLIVIDRIINGTEKIDLSIIDESIQTEEEKFDSLLYEAIKIVLSNNQITPALLQRGLNIGFARIGRIIDQMERIGIVIMSKDKTTGSILVGSDDIDNILESNNITKN